MTEEVRLQAFEVTKEYDGIRLDKFLALIYPEKSRSFFQRLIKEKQVRINLDFPKASYQVSLGELVEIRIPPTVQVEIKPEDIPLDILYEDDDLLIINKPKDMVVHPAPGHYTGTLVNAIMFHCKNDLSGINGQIRPGIVHRIDKDTTGSLIVCKNDEAHLKISEQIKAHSLTRRYRGIVCGRVKEEAGVIDRPIGRDPKNRLRMACISEGRRAVTHFKLLEYLNGYTYMEFELETGRTHQIRVHMASIGHPLLGDPLYGPAKCPFHLQGQCLHAMTIGFVHPRKQIYIEVSAPLPEYFEKLLDKLRMKQESYPCASSKVTG